MAQRTYNHVALMSTNEEAIELGTYGNKYYVAVVGQATAYYNYLDHALASYHDTVEGA